MLTKKSFTLIELMTVIGIIAILAGLMLVGYNVFFSEADIGSSMRFDSSIHHSLGYALVGDWKMDDNAANSTVVDTSGNGNNGTFYINGTEENTEDYSVDGVNGRALDFKNFDDDYIYINTSKSLNNFNELTISVWINPQSHSSYDRIVEKNIWGAGTFAMFFGDVSTKINFGIENQNNNRAYVTSSEAPLNKWSYVVATWDGEQMTIYFNGKNNDTQLQNGVLSSSRAFHISDSGTNSFHGYIDQVRVYKAALTASQIKQQYYTGLHRLYKKGLISREEYIKRIVQK